MLSPQVLVSLLATASLALAGGSQQASWAGWGGGIYNNRWTDSQIITTSNVNSLTQTCQLSYQFGVSATPVVLGRSVYYPTWNGSFVALDYTTCKVQWMLNVTKIINDFAPLSPETVQATYQASRTSPQIDGDILYFGTQTHALLVAVNRLTGKFLAATSLNPHPLAVVTISPTVYKGTIFVGTSSYEEPAPLFWPDYPCCSYIGNMIALTFNARMNKFTVKWDIPTLPSPPAGNSEVWWSGAGVWGSQPSIDPQENQVFFGTGNVYSFPPTYAHCVNETSDCLPPGVNQEAVIAIDIASGKTNWVRRVTPMDAWNGACVLTPIDKENCPSEPPGRDGDFGMAPTFVPRHASGLKDDIVVVGQKNAVIYAFSASSGRTVWMKNVSPQMQGGGISWGIAVDDKRIYYTLPYSRRGLPFNVSSSVYGAASLTSGKVLWETPATLMVNAIALQPPTVAGGLVLYPQAGVITSDGSPSDYDNSRGSLVVIEKVTGQIIKEMEMDTSFQGGIAVVGEYVLFGTGYRNGVFYLGNGSLNVLKVVTRPRHGKE